MKPGIWKQIFFNREFLPFKDINIIVDLVEVKMHQFKIKIREKLKTILFWRLSEFKAKIVHSV